MKIKITALVLALLAVTTLFAGCSTSNRTSDKENSLEMPQPKPLTEAEITLVALQVTVPENSPYLSHKIDYELYEEVLSENSETSVDIKGDTSVDAEAYAKYCNSCKLEDKKISDAAIEKIIINIYGADNYVFKFGGDQKIALDDGRYGILKTVIVQPFDGNKQETFEVLLTGKQQ